MRIERYTEGDRVRWDEFVRSSKNGTFLFFRDYMEYHSDRFRDYSLLIWNDRDRLIALLPANVEGDTLTSHEGLTYGGFIMDAKMRLPLMLDVFESTLNYLKQHKIRQFIYKAIPHIYHHLPAEEDHYALFRQGAQLYRRDVTTTVIPQAGVALQERRRRSIHRARAAGLTWGASTDFGQFWSILKENLWIVHHTQPVHSLAEICQLRNAFPEHIKLFAAFHNAVMLAGTVIYESPNVAHAQYIANSSEGRACGALDFLFSKLITEQYLHKKYFDLGKSTEDDGHYLNAGLISFKEGFGGTSITHDFYKLVLG